MRPSHIIIWNETIRDSTTASSFRQEQPLRQTGRCKPAADSAECSTTITARPHDFSFWTLRGHRGGGRRASGRRYQLIAAGDTSFDGNALCRLRRSRRRRVQISELFEIIGGIDLAPHSQFEMRALAADITKVLLNRRLSWSRSHSCNGRTGFDKKPPEISPLGIRHVTQALPGRASC